VNVAEILLGVVGLSLNVFLVAQYEGTMVRAIQWTKLAILCLIFFIWQVCSMLLGYAVTRIDFFDTKTLQLQQFCYAMAGIIFLALAGYMIFRAVRREVIIERLREIGYRRVCAEAAMIACFTFLAGIGWGFIGRSITTAAAVMGCATVLSVICGIYMGFREGCRFRYAIYALGGVMLAVAGIMILIHYL